MPSSAPPAAAAALPSAAAAPRPTHQVALTDDDVDADDLPPPDLAAPLLRPRRRADSFTWFAVNPTSTTATSVAIMPTFGKKGTIALLCVINLFNYIDRGIIPGAPEKFQHFITKTLHVGPTEQSLYLGLLASSFIASYSICSILFGYLATKFRPFRMIAFGMSVWVIAVICCGIAYSLESYYFLMFGRVLSGVGEASFQCNATPFINTHAPPKNRALWMGVFLASITVGTAVGYIYGSVLASTSLTWAGAFYIEGAIMVGLILCCLKCVSEELDCVPTETGPVVDTPGELVEELLHDSSVHKHKATGAIAPTASATRASFFAKWWELFRNPTFTLVVFGHAAYTFSLAALSVFIPVILIGLGMYEKETEVATAFGALIVLTGTIGTPIGGILVDRLCKRDGVTQDKRAWVSVKVIFGLLVAAFGTALLMMALTDSKFAFLSVLAICFFFLCMLTPAEAIVVMELFPENRHAMAVAANTLIIHVFGDVPSPIILGWLKDTWAPHCGTVDDGTGSPILNPECPKDREGLKDVLLFPVLWLIWGVVLWGAAVFALRRRQAKQAASSEA